MSSTTSKSIDAIFSIESVTLSTVLLMAVMILSCSKKSDDSPGAETPQQVIQFSGETDFKNFTVTGIVNTNDPVGYKDYLEERYTNSCVIRRNNRGEIIAYRQVSGFEDDLRGNDTVFYTVTSQNQYESKKTEQSLKVISANDKFATMQSSILSIVIPQAGGEILLASIIDQPGCVWSKGTPLPFCKGDDRPIDFYRPFVTIQGFEYLKNASMRPKQNCSIVGQVSSISSTEKGIFKLQNEQSLNAYRTTTTETGSIMCNGSLMGVGEVTTISIHSSDIKAMPGLEGFARGGNFSCGGTLVAETRVMKTQAGVLEAMRFEQKQPVLK